MIDDQHCSRKQATLVMQERWGRYPIRVEMWAKRVDRHQACTIDSSCSHFAGSSSCLIGRNAMATGDAIFPNHGAWRLLASRNGNLAPPVPFFGMLPEPRGATHRTVISGINGAIVYCTSLTGTEDAVTDDLFQNVWVDRQQWHWHVPSYRGSFKNPPRTLRSHCLFPYSVKKNTGADWDITNDLHRH